MKLNHIIPLFAAAVLLSCGDESVTDEIQTPLEELNDVVEDLNDELTEIEGVEEIYSITSESAGDFVLGGPIPSSTDDYSVKKEDVIVQTEDGPYEETVYIVSNGDAELVRISQAVDYETGEYLFLIGEMNVFSDRFQTAEGIGVGSTVTEFMDTYPDFKIWYTYISDMYVIQTDGLAGQFLLDGNGFGGEITEFVDMVDLNSEDFKADTKIVSVRMF